MPEPNIVILQYLLYSKYNYFSEYSIYFNIYCPEKFPGIPGYHGRLCGNLAMDHFMPVITLSQSGVLKSHRPAGEAISNFQTFPIPITANLAQNRPQSSARCRTKNM